MMRVSIGEWNFILHQYYSKKVLNASSALSASFKQSVQTQELVRRMVNTSVKLNWDESVAPVFTDYMGRMFEAGYDQSYRRIGLEDNRQSGQSSVRTIVRADNCQSGQLLGGHLSGRTFVHDNFF